MHTLYLAHDSTWAAVLLHAAAHHDWHWFLTLAGLNDAVQTCLGTIMKTGGPGAEIVKYFQQPRFGI